MIRVSDGEKAALDYCEDQRRHRRGGPDDLLLCCDAGFRKRFGVEGISCGEISKRIYAAADECDYFAPTLGFFNEPYNLTPYFSLFTQRDMVCEMYQYHWPWKRRRDLMSVAGRVLVINRDAAPCERLQARLPECEFIHLPLDNWRESEEVLKEAVMLNPRLTLMSAALGSKYIGPRLSKLTYSVVLDIGQAADVWHLE